MARIDTGADYVIRGVANPEQNNDAANKAYVDGASGTNTTYTLPVTALFNHEVEGTTYSGGRATLTGSDGTTQDLNLLAGSNIQISRTDDNLIFASTGGGGGVGVTRSANPPTVPTPTPGSLWFRTTDGRLFLYNMGAAWIHIGDAINRLFGTFGLPTFTTPTDFLEIDGGDFTYKVYPYVIDGGTF